MNYLKNMNIKIYIILYSLAILAMLYSFIFNEENRSISLLFALLGMYFLYKRIKNNNQHLNNN